MVRPPRISPPLPTPPLSQPRFARRGRRGAAPGRSPARTVDDFIGGRQSIIAAQGLVCVLHALRSEEHTSELQSQSNLVCRLLLEKKELLLRLQTGAGHACTC